MSAERKIINSLRELKKLIKLKNKIERACDLKMIQLVREAKRKK